jgi:thioredoxin-related protein
MKNKNLFLLIFISFALYFPASLSAQEKDQKQPSGKEAVIKWYSFEEAYKLSKKKPKRMMVDVYTEWCGWCKKMDAETFTDPVIVKYVNAHFYAVKLDAERKDTVVIDGVKMVNPNPGNKRSTHQLANELLHGSMSYPSYVFLNEEGKYIVTIPGYHKAREFEAMLSFFGEGAYEKVKPEDFQRTFDQYLSTFQGKVK